MIDAIFQYVFMRNALLAAILSSIVCGIIGTIIVEKKLVSMSGGIAHTSFGGIGLGYLLGIEPIIGGLVFSVLASLSIPVINRNTKTNADTIIGIFWSVGMALGIFFISLMPGYPPDMTTYLFGDILTVSGVYLKAMVVLTLIVIIIIGTKFDYWKAYLFDEEFAKLMKLPVKTYERTLFVLIAFSIVVLLKVVGIILVIALLTIPPATAKLFSYNLKSMMLISIMVGMIYSIGGLYISYTFDIASGASIILFAASTYFILLIIKKWIRK